MEATINNPRPNQVVNSATQAVQQLINEWSDTVPALFPPSSDPAVGSTFDPDSVNARLFQPILALIADSTDPSELSFEALSRKYGGNSGGKLKDGQICGHVFKAGELTYTCRECANDVTCVMCYPCFSHSAHFNHKYKMHSSGGSGYCDCGDPEAWSSAPTCSLHDPSANEDDTQMDNDEQGIDPVPEEIQQRLRAVMRNLIGYAMDVISWEGTRDLPLRVSLPSEQSSSSAESTHQTVLFNDEHHTYDTVIKCLQMSIKCSEETAQTIATIVDRDGRTNVLLNDLEGCEKVAKMIRAKSKENSLRAGKDDSLKVEVMISCLVAHQQFAIELLRWITAGCSKFQRLSEIVGEILLVEKAESNGDLFAVQIMREDAKFWKAARTAWHNILMGSVLMDMGLKKRFSRLYIEHYDALCRDFIRDDHDHSISIMSLSVQILTVPTVARMLMAEEDALSRIFRTILDHFSSYIDTQKGCKVIIEFMSRIQGMDPAKRQPNEANHVEFEPEWETAFNIQLRIQFLLNLVVEWAMSDREVFIGFTTAVLAAQKRALTGIMTESVTVYKSDVNCVAHDVSTDELSIHLPITRMLSALMSCHKHRLKITDLVSHHPFNNDQSAIPSYSELLELPLRIMVMGAQVNADMWRKNGYSILNQVHNYMSPLCRVEMFDRDILMIQNCACELPPDNFVIQTLHKFGLSDWAQDEFDLALADADILKTFKSISESFFQLLIQICGERWNSEIGEGMSAESELRREVLHILCLGPMAFSKIDKRIPDDPKYVKLTLEKIIKAVADLRIDEKMGPTTFELKKEFRKEYNPYFWHYSRTDNSSSIKYLSKICKDEDSILGPPELPRVREEYANLSRILTCPTTIYLVDMVIHRCCKKSRFASEGQLHRVLFLLCMAIDEELKLVTDVAQRDKENKMESQILKTLMNIHGVDAASKLLPIIEQITQNPDYSQMTKMIGMVVQRLRTLMVKYEYVSAESSSRGRSSDGMDTSDESSEEAKRAARRKVAEMKRAKALGLLIREQKAINYEIEDANKRN